MSHLPRAPLSRRLQSMRRRVRHKVGQLRRASRETLQLVLVLIGASLVSLLSFGFAHLADIAIATNTRWLRDLPWLGFVLLPFGLAAICWLTTRLAPAAAGSGIPQVIAAISLPDTAGSRWLVALGQACWKIPLTFLGLLVGASIGREGPSVQVGAALMLAWGGVCRRLGVPLRGVRPSELIAAGAAGGLAAAFNAPLAGVIFAIEELGRGTGLRWHRVVLYGVVVSGFVMLATMGSNPYLGAFHGSALAHDMVFWTLLCASVSGVFGGIFGRLLSKGPAMLLPARARGWVVSHPVATAFLLGLVIALLGLLTANQVYGTGYSVASRALEGGVIEPSGFFLAKITATLASYWAGIPGGIFTPILTAGAGIGAEIGRFVGEGIDTRVLVLVSMAALLAGATQAPITASVIVMEMTGSQSMLFWLLFGSLVSSMVAKQFCPHPFYHFSAGRYRQMAYERDHPADKTTA